MASQYSVLADEPLRHGRQTLRREWGWFLALCVTLILLGGLAIGKPLVVILTTVTLFSIFLVVGGGVVLSSVFWASRWNRLLLQVLIGSFASVCGHHHDRLPRSLCRGLHIDVGVVTEGWRLGPNCRPNRVAISEMQRGLLNGWSWVILDLAICKFPDFDA